MRWFSALPVLFSLLSCVSLLEAQGPGIIPVHSSFERAYAVVPMIGSGTVQDPLRPMFVPAQGFAKGRSLAAGLISYSYQMSDDGKSALVEFVSTNREGLREILESRAPGVRALEKGRHPRAEIENAFQAKKRDFDFAKFPVNKVR